MRVFVLSALMLLFHGISDTEVILWDKNTKLTWSDFRGKAKVPGRHVAMSKCGISMKTSYVEGNLTKPEFNFYAYFEPASSWYIKGKVDNLVLQHEQLHFDIAGLYALKMKKLFSGRNIDTKTAQKEFDRLFALYQQTQNNYDNETLNGQDKNAQKRWLKKIHHQLNYITF